MVMEPGEQTMDKPNVAFLTFLLAHAAQMRIASCSAQCSNLCYISQRQVLFFSHLEDARFGLANLRTRLQDFKKQCATITGVRCTEVSSLLRPDSSGAIHAKS